MHIINYYWAFMLNLEPKYLRIHKRTDFSLILWKKVKIQNYVGSISKWPSEYQAQDIKTHDKVGH